MNVELTKEKAPIRGWLIVLAVCLWAAPFLEFLIFIEGLLGLHTHEVRFDIQTVDGLIHLIVSIPFLLLFMNRRKAFVKWYLVFQIYAFAVETVLLILNLHIHKSIVPNIIGYILIVVIVLYLTRSKRVKDTFVK